MPGEQISSIAQTSVNSPIQGLSTKEAKDRLEEYGLNKLPEKPPPSSLQIFIAQLKNPLVYILLGAGAVTLFLGEAADTAIIGLAVFINTILGFVQEKKAGDALAALKKLVHPEAQVLRDGKRVTVPVEHIVPDDIILLKEGDKIPADGFLVEHNRFFVSEAILTGESEPIKKKKDNEVYMGTIVTSGTAKMQIEVTGGKTEMGKIAEGISQDNEKTPLGKQLESFSKKLTIVVLSLVVVAFVIGLISGREILEIFTTSVALAVSAVPEGLLVGLTAVLAIGMQRILKRKGLVRNLVSAETLGGVTTICVDKTGTLTQGKMQVVEVFGNEEEIAKHAVVANDLDTSVVVSAWNWANENVKDVDALCDEYESIDSIPFTSKNKFFARLNSYDSNKRTIFVTGAPELLMDASNLSSEEKQEIQNKIKEFTSKGRRLLGYARKDVESSLKQISEDKVLEDLSWTGMLAFDDPVREDVRDALEKTRASGINLMVITGDYADTARSVLMQLGIEIEDEDVLLGSDLNDLSDKELERKIFEQDGDGNRKTKLFARTKPDQKLKLVETLKLHGEVVAMMGDGVNDAPALSKADIGIVVGEATDVAKESADLVLLDSSFKTIVAAIEEGRVIFDNIRKIILYLLVDAFEGILVVLSTLILRLPLPITAAQILWVNLVSDGFPHLALTVDPKDPNIMKRKPRPPQENLVTGWMTELIALVSIIGWVFAFAAYYYFYKTTGDIVLARSVTFATIGVNSLVYVFSVRTLTEPFWKEGLFENKWLILAVMVGLVFQIVPFMTEGTRSFFELEPLGMYWGIAFGASILMFFSIEGAKWVFRKHLG